MKRHQFMLDLLRTELTLESQVQSFQYKSELTLEDYELIIKNCDVVKKAAEIRKKTRCF